MRPLRKLAQGVWYEIRSRINNREPILSSSKAAALFNRVFQETMLRFPFEVRNLRFEADWLSFYIKPEDGEALPKILQWMKQVFAQRYNGMEGRIGHIWGDRYGSRILEGEPEEGEAVVVGEMAEHEIGNENGVRPQSRKQQNGTGSPPIFIFSLDPKPG
jgi:REP element-mobilizing transposase RayT